jgi:superfamily II DNA/RNA helicase
MIKAGVLRRPRVIVATVPSEQSKTSYVKSLIAKRRGRALIFCDWIQQGQQLADALDVPFVHGATARKLQVVEESEVCVVSRIGDRGISLPDLRLVIEVAGAGSSREQFAQRLGRLLHGNFEGVFVTVFTPQEIAKYRSRIFGAEAELAGEVDIEFIEVGKVPSVSMETRPHKSSSSGRSASVRTSPAKPAREEKPKDEIAQTLALPPVAAKVKQAQSQAPDDTRIRNKIPQVIRFCWSAALSPKEIGEGLGEPSARNVARLTAACEAAAKVGLLVLDGEGRYRVNQQEIERLKALSTLRK